MTGLTVLPQDLGEVFSPAGLKGVSADGVPQQAGSRSARFLTLRPGAPSKRPCPVTVEVGGVLTPLSVRWLRDGR